MKYSHNERLFFVVIVMDVLYKDLYCIKNSVSLSSSEQTTAFVARHCLCNAGCSSVWFPCISKKPSHTQCGEIFNVHE